MFSKDNTVDVLIVFLKENGFLALEYENKLLLFCIVLKTQFLFVCKSVYVSKYSR